MREVKESTHIMRNQYEKGDAFKALAGLGMAVIIFIVAKSSSTVVLSGLILKALLFSLMHCIAGGIDF